MEHPYRTLQNQFGTFNTPVIPTLGPLWNPCGTLLQPAVLLWNPCLTYGTLLNPLEPSENSVVPLWSKIDNYRISLETLLDPSGTSLESLWNPNHTWKSLGGEKYKWSNHCYPPPSNHFGTPVCPGMQMKLPLLYPTTPNKLLSRVKGGQILNIDQQGRKWKGRGWAQPPPSPPG